MFVAAGVMLAGCATKMAGSPRAGAEAVVTSESSENDTGDSESSESNSEDGALDDVAPCDLLSAEDRVDLGLESGVQDTALEDEGCSWAGTHGPSVSIYLSADNGFDESKLDDPSTPVSLQNHEAHQIIEQEKGFCSVVIEISESSYVDILATDDYDTSGACDFAYEVATVVDPKLP